MRPSKKLEKMHTLACALAANGNWGDFLDLKLQVKIYKQFSLVIQTDAYSSVIGEVCYKTNFCLRGKYISGEQFGEPEGLETGKIDYGLLLDLLKDKDPKYKKYKIERTIFTIFCLKGSAVPTYNAEAALVEGERRFNKILDMEV